MSLNNYETFIESEYRKLGNLFKLSPPITIDEFREMILKSEFEEYKEKNPEGIENRSGFQQLTFNKLWWRNEKINQIFRDGIRRVLWYSDGIWGLKRYVNGELPSQKGWKDAFSYFLMQQKGDKNV